MEFPIVDNLPEIEIVVNREKQAKLICAELNNFIDIKNTLYTILEYIQNLSRCNFVSVRLKENNDYPYYVYKGFTDSFIKHESSICKDFTNHSSHSEIELECICGLVISSKTIPNCDCFTNKGSFWTNDCLKTIENLQRVNEDIKIRNYCFNKGYNSIALIPIIVNKVKIGLIQLNNKKKNIFSSSFIEFMEMIADQVGLAISNSLVYEQLRKEKDQLSAIVTELERTQNQLVESEKMASLGRLVAGVAHEINTPLGIGITATTAFIKENELLEKKFTDGSLKKSDLENNIETNKETGQLILRNLQRTAKLIKNFKNTSIDQISEKKRIFDVVDYTQQIISNLQIKIKGKKITFKVNPKNEVLINSYPGVFNQILTNLIINSYNHGFNLLKEGNISIRIKSDCGILFIKYSDTGCGIPKENLKNIFEPFFTTNHKEGTGLGLHIVYNLITQSLKGTVSCRSPKNGGTIFEIELPIN